MRKWIAALAFVLGGCAAQIPYTANTPVSNPESLIEQALMEQERDRRPDFVHTTHEYVEFGQDTATTTNQITLKQTSRHHVTRMYWRSIADTKLFSKRGNYIVQFRNAQGVLLAMVVTYDPETARRLIDAVETMKAG